MKELMVILRKYVELTRIPYGDRDFYDQQKVEDLEELYSRTMNEMIDKRVEEALEQHENGKYHDNCDY
jgi:predicted RNase H-related nuclease YkuK (DUF458 family)